MEMNRYLKMVCFLVLGSTFLMFSCRKESEIEIVPESKVVETRAVPTPNFDWENADWMPTPVGQSRIPSPWVGAGSLASIYGLEILNDCYRIDGWELMYSSFDAMAPGALIDPYFVLYNKYRGTMRVFLYLTTPFVVSSSYLQDGISIVSNQQTSMLNFLGKAILDVTAPNQKNYTQVQPAPPDGSMPLASNKWYMMEYELAYDPNIASMAYNNIQLSWFLNYSNIAKIEFTGKEEGRLNAIVGMSSENSSNDLKTALSNGTDGLKLLGTGVLAGVGVSILDNNKVNVTNDSQANNKLGVKNSIFTALYKGITGALQGALQSFPKSVIGFFSGIIGGRSSSGVPPVSYQVDTEISLDGTATSSGSFPSSPNSFWIPGTTGLSGAVGYIPLYNKTLGVVNFVGTPTINSHQITYEYQVFDPIAGDYINRMTETYFDQTADFSSHIIFNPEVLAIANVRVLYQDLFVRNSWTGEYIALGEERKYTCLDMDGFYDEAWGYDWQRAHYFNVYVRFTIEVKPKNGTPASKIIKSIKLKEGSQSYEDLGGIPNPFIQ